MRGLGKHRRQHQASTISDSLGGTYHTKRAGRMDKDKGPSDSASRRRQVFAFIGILITISVFGDPNSGLIDIPLSFVLKNILKLDPTEVSQLRLVAAVPLVFSFVFGWTRDRWSPHGTSDRGYLMTFAGLSTLTYLTFAFVPTSVVTLMAALVVLSIWSLFIASAQNGLAVNVAQDHHAIGQVSTIWSCFTALSAVGAFWMGGALTKRLELADPEIAVRSILLVGAAVSAVLMIFVLAWRPVALDSRFTTPKASSLVHELRRLVSDQNARRALMVWALWNFAPGSATALQFFLQDVLGGSGEDWGTWNAVFTASFIPTYLLFGFLSARISLNRLLTWSTLIAIPQFVPLLSASSVSSAMYAAMLMGLMGGMATAGYLALIMRSAPVGLEGTMMMSASTVYFAAARLGDVFGSVLYERSGGLSACVVVTLVIYCGIWFLLPARAARRAP